MDQLIFASLSHTHYRYEVGMLKVPYCTVFHVIRIRTCYCIVYNKFNPPSNPFDLVSSQILTKIRRVPLFVCFYSWGQCKVVFLR